MKSQAYVKVQTVVERDGYPAGSIGVVVSIYGEGPGCEVELWDEDEYPIDVVTYSDDELVVIDPAAQALPSCALPSQ